MMAFDTNTEKRIIKRCNDILSTIQQSLDVEEDMIADLKTFVDYHDVTKIDPEGPYQVLLNFYQSPSDIQDHEKNEFQQLVRNSIQLRIKQLQLYQVLNEIGVTMDEIQTLSESQLDELLQDDILPRLETVLMLFSLHLEQLMALENRHALFDFTGEIHDIVSLRNTPVEHVLALDELPRQLILMNRDTVIAMMCDSDVPFILIANTKPDVLHVLFQHPVEIVRLLQTGLDYHTVINSPQLLHWLQTAEVDYLAESMSLLLAYDITQDQIAQMDCDRIMLLSEHVDVMRDLHRRGMPLSLMLELPVQRLAIVFHESRFIDSFNDKLIRNLFRYKQDILSGYIRGLKEKESANQENLSSKVFNVGKVK
ncbi:MAG: hypothetical protein KDH94_05915 [Coxiellaceae bacterium]|nr:hypothetical protein [Coxiellaceae bacterium]